MDDKYAAQRQDEHGRDASNPREDERDDDLARRRKLYERPQLTKREQQERWPIG